jgi:hypothetical protein
MNSSPQAAKNLESNARRVVSTGHDPAIEFSDAAVHIGNETVPHIDATRRGASSATPVAPGVRRIASDDESGFVEKIVSGSPQRQQILLDDRPNDVKIHGRSSHE